MMLIKDRYYYSVINSNEWFGFSVNQQLDFSAVAQLLTSNALALIDDRQLTTSPNRKNSDPTIYQPERYCLIVFKNKMNQNPKDCLLLLKDQALGFTQNKTPDTAAKPCHKSTRCQKRTFKSRTKTNFGEKQYRCYRRQQDDVIKNYQTSVSCPIKRVRYRQLGDGDPFKRSNSSRSWKNQKKRHQWQ